MKKTNLEKLLASAIGVLFIASSGCAAGINEPSAQPSADKSFELMDSSKDGKVVIEEFKTAYPNMSEQAFIIIDKNGDKTIDRLEWAEFARQHAKPSKEKGTPMNNIPGDPLIPPPDSSDLPLMRPPVN